MQKQLTGLAACAALFAGPAHALKVTNLDSVSHTVIYRSAGEAFEQSIAPQNSVHFHGKPDGMLSIKRMALPAEKPAKKHAKKSAPAAVSAPDTIAADGVLSGVFSASRSENIPAASNYDFVIWPGGSLRIQSHRNGNVF